MKKCLVWDWVSINVLVKRGALEKEHSNYIIRNDNRSTRHYKNTYYIYTNEHDEIAYIQTDPTNVYFNEEQALLKINNKYLYQQNFKAFLIGFLADFGFFFKSYSRLDCAMDFIQFYNNMSPITFMNNYAQKKYLRFNKSEFGLFGKEGGKDGMEYQTLNFGSKKSSIVVTLYNKSKEMEKVKHKQWIFDNWLDAGYKKEMGDVWRLEFKMKKTNTALVIPNEDGEAVQKFNMNDINCIDNIEQVYSTNLYNHFRFVHKEKTASGNLKRKDRCKPLKLLGEKFTYKLVSMKLSDAKESNRMDRVFAKHLDKYSFELSGQDFELSILVNEMLGYYIMSRGLQDWAEKKLGFIVSEKQQKQFYDRDLTTLMYDLDYQKKINKGQFSSNNIRKTLKEMYPSLTPKELNKLIVDVYERTEQRKPKK